MASNTESPAIWRTNPPATADVLWLYEQSARGFWENQAEFPVHDDLIDSLKEKRVSDEKLADMRMVYTAVGLRSELSREVLVYDPADFRTKHFLLNAPFDAQTLETDLLGAVDLQQVQAHPRVIGLREHPTPETVPIDVLTSGFFGFYLESGRKAEVWEYVPEPHWCGGRFPLLQLFTRRAGRISSLVLLDDPDRGVEYRSLRE